MNTNSGPEKLAGGMDQSYRPKDNKASLVKNFRVDDDLGWINDRGWEPRIELGAPIVLASATLSDVFSPVRFLSVWSRHQNGEVYYLNERNGKLRYEFSNKGTATSREVILDTERNEPKVDDPGTQLAPFGRFALVLNGYDAPLKFWGRELVEPFSWTAAPPPPHILNVDPSVTETGGPAANLDGESATIRFDSSNSTYHGLGDKADASVNSYSWRIAFKSNTGSISPLSPSTTIRWSISGSGQEARYGVVFDDLPIGPAGTVSRMIYRTKNKKDGRTGAGDVFYFVDEVVDNITKVYIDITPDNQLVDSIDTASFAQPISHGYKYAAAFNNQMFLAGGEAHPTRIVFSRPNLPEEFPRYYYFDVGNTTGGHITGLYAYYNMLIVFREKSIDVITATGTGSDGAPIYQIATLDQNVGTTSTNTIKYVPGVGVCFLSRDGVYTVTGGLQGGAIHGVKKISDDISKEMKRLSTGALARATATYSDKEKEYWVHYPVDGDTENSRGAVLHTRIMQWSLRGPMSFTCLATDPDGWIVIGTYQVYNSITGAANKNYPGLQIWSAAPYWGKQLIYQGIEEGYATYLVTEVAKEESVWESVWEDFNSPLKKNIHNVEIECVAMGNNPITLYYASDYKEAFTSAGAVKPQQAEYVDSSSSQPVYGPNSTKLKAVWGSTIWAGGHIVRMRWDGATGAVNHFKFQIKTANLFHIISYKIDFTTGGQKTLSTQNKSY